MSAADKAAARRAKFEPLVLVGLFLIQTLASLPQSMQIPGGPGGGNGLFFYVTLLAGLGAVAMGPLAKALGARVAQAAALTMAAGCAVTVASLFLAGDLAVAASYAAHFLNMAALLLVLLSVLGLEGFAGRAFGAGLVLGAGELGGLVWLLLDTLTHNANAPAGGGEQVAAILGVAGLAVAGGYLVWTRSAVGRRKPDRGPGAWAEGREALRRLFADRLRSRLLLARVLVTSFALTALALATFDFGVLFGNRPWWLAWTGMPVVGILIGAWLADGRSAGGILRLLTGMTLAIIPLTLFAVISKSDPTIIVARALATAVVSATLAPTYLLLTDRTEAADRPAVVALAYGLFEFLAWPLALGAMVALVILMALGGQTTGVDTAFPGSLRVSDAGSSIVFNMLLPLKVEIAPAGQEAARSLLAPVGAILSLLLLLPAWMFRGLARGLEAAPSAPGACQACGAPTLAEARFCAECGAPVAAPSAGRPERKGALVPWIGVVAVPSAILLAAGLAQAAGLFDPGYSDRIVWSAPQAANQALRDCAGNLACSTSVMKSNGASAEAVKFSTDYAAFQSDSGAGFATKFHEFGRVDVAEVFAPWEGQEGTTRVVMLDKHRMIAPLSPEVAEKTYRGDPATGEIWSVFPDAGIFSQQELVSASKLPGGGQRIVLASLVQKGCRACEVIGSPQMAYDFNAKGELISQMVLPGDEKSDWRVAITKQRQLAEAAARVEAEMQAAAEEQAFNNSILPLDQMIGADPTNAVAYKMRCWARADAGRQLDAALADCDRALQLNPNFAVAYDNRGLVHLRRGEWAAALSDFNQALRLDANQIGSLYGRGLAKVKLGQTEAGQADMAAAMNRNSGLAGRFEGWGLSP